MKTQLFIFALLCSAGYSSFGQACIKGRIKDRQQDLPAATVLLLDSNSTLVKGVVTDITGEFIFENVASGLYIISSSMVGYSKFFSQHITVKENMVLPDIVLEEVATELNEVVIAAEKPLFEQRIDRLVVNVQQSITSSGNTVLEVLQKSPGVVVNRQNNNITMNGKSGVRIMINDKLTQLPLDVVVQMLDGMNSSNVEKIELIATPPAKYDAEGNAGIIHIVTKENAEYGTNGSFGLMLGARWAETLSGNFNLGHRNEKFVYSFDYSILRNHNQHLLQMTRQSLVDGFFQTVNDQSRRENVTTQQNLSAGFEWKLNNSTSMNLGLTGYRRNWDMTAVAIDNSQFAVDSTVITSMNIYESNIWQNITGTVGLHSKINSKSEISFNLDYLYYHNDNPSNYKNQSLYEQRNISDASEIDLTKTTPIRFFIASTDYQYYFSPSFIIEVGIKGVSSALDNNVHVERRVNNAWALDPIFTSVSKLNEQVGAAYISTKWQPGRMWQINSGLRYEYTHTSISTPTEKNLINRKYGYLFPSLFLQKDFGLENDVQFSYTRRITRPTYNDIAPFVFFWGPNTFSAGNTSLFSAITDAIKAGYHLKQWIISLQFSHSRKEINSWQPETDSESNLTYRSQNLKYLNTLGLTNSYSFTIAPWWEVQSNITAQYQVVQTSHLKSNTTFHLYGSNLNVTNILKLPKDFFIEISGMYQSKTLSGIAEYLSTGSLNAGIRKQFRDKGTLSFSMDDILDTNYWRIKTNLPQNNLNSYFNYNFHNQFVRITYTRNLGNNKLQSLKFKSASEEERGRIGN